MQMERDVVALSSLGSGQNDGGVLQGVSGDRFIFREGTKRSPALFHERSLVDMRRDKYFRVLAGIRGDGRDVTRQLIEAGLDIPYNGGT
jgi:hypothetical protein